MQNQITEWGTALMTSLASAMTLLFLAIPKIIGFLAIVIIGWLIASLLARAVGALLRSVKFNELAQRSGLAGFVQNMGMNMDSAGLIGAMVRWFVRLVALVVAFDALGLPAVSDVLRSLLLWLPNVVVAVVILVIAGLVAGSLGRLARGAAAEAELRNADLMGKLVSGLVWGFGIIVAISQIGIATVFVNTLWMALIGALALALGLAFGLGGRDVAARIVRDWYGKRLQQGRELLSDTEGAAAVRNTGIGSLSERRLQERRAG